MARKTLFITATETGVGKTAVAASIAAILRKRGRDVGVLKPIATGCDEIGGRLVSSDAVCLAAAAGVHDEDDLVCPVRYKYPLAPMVAAELERRPIDYRAIRRAFKELRRRHDCLIIEGIGGIMVPLTAKRSVVDFAAEIGAPILVVGRIGLGTINHTLLTVECARSHGLKVAGIVLNTPQESVGGIAAETNPAAIAQLTKLPVLGPLDFCRTASTDEARLGRLPIMLERLQGFEQLLGRVFG